MPKRKKQAWSEEEDMICTQAVKDYLKRTKEYYVFKETNKFPVGFPWKKVSKNVPKRNGKQCRERWKNQIAPGIKKSPWTGEEDNMLKQLFTEHSSKWKLISGSLPGRPENQCKMRWKALLIQGLESFKCLPTAKKKRIHKCQSNVKIYEAKQYRTNKVDDHFESYSELDSFLNFYDDHFENLNDFDNLFEDEVTTQKLCSNSLDIEFDYHYEF